MIKIKNLSHFINDKKILSEIDLVINSKKFTAILGANGAGKTTLLKCLTAILKPSEGEIFFDNKNIHEFSISELAKKRAVFSQGAAINFPFSVFEIVNMGRNPYSYEVSSKRNEKIIDEILEKLEIYDLKHRDFTTLSLGQQQRVQLARVLAQIWEEENAFLFLDEPTSALDLKHQHQFLSLLMKLKNERFLTIIAIMHDLKLASFYADDVILMKSARLVKYGTRGDILNKGNVAEIFDISLEVADIF